MTNPNYLTVNQFAEKYPAFRTSSLRSLIFNEHRNGLAQYGAIQRVGRKVIIESNRFFSWVEAQNQVGAK
ncbi:MAG: hypothetical protein Q7T96_08150 [Methylobacter sp.]|nr:hypothetical protein [Methylobacter sp.]